MYRYVFEFCKNVGIVGHFSIEPMLASRAVSIKHANTHTHTHTHTHITHKSCDLFLLVQRQPKVEKVLDEHSRPLTSKNFRQMVQLCFLKSSCA